MRENLINDKYGLLRPPTSRRVSKYPDVTNRDTRTRGCSFRSRLSECDKEKSGREAETQDRRENGRKGKRGHGGVIEMRGGAGGERGRRGCR